MQGPARALARVFGWDSNIIAKPETSRLLKDFLAEQKYTRTSMFALFRTLTRHPREGARRSCYLASVGCRCTGKP